MWIFPAVFYSFIAIIAYEYEKSINPSKTRAIMHAIFWFPKYIYKLVSMIAK